MKPVCLCEQCHGELPGDAPEGLCPKCLLKLGGVELGIPVREQEAQADNSGSEAQHRRFGNYEILEQVGQGGMGTVYKARQLNLDRLVALKLLPFGQFSRDDLLQRFRSEASAAAALQHPNIVAVHDVGEHDGQPFFSMDFVEGRTLAELVRDQPLPAKRAAAYLKTIAEAVHYAHQHGILHRDLKPSNILVDAFDQPRITDFGLAKRLGGDSDLTLTGQVLGSPNFISPEQAEGRSDAVGPPSDVYSLGALLYHLLTRQPPFQADTLTTLLKQVLEVEPIPPRSLNPSIPKDLETICLKCLEKEAHRRYPTAQALADDLGRFLNHEAVEARPIPTAAKAWRWCRRRPVRSGLIGSLALVLVLGIFGISREWRRAERERDTALRHVYAGDMKGAQFALEEGNLGGALRLLDKYRPGGKAEGRRLKFEAELPGWEWRYLWGLCRSDEQSKLTQQAESFANLALSPDGKLLALCRQSGSIDLWDWKGHRHVGTLTNRSYPPAMAFSPDGTFIAAANSDRTGKPVISFWDVAGRRIVRDLPQRSVVTSMAISPDGKRLAAFHFEPVCSLWDLPSGALVTNHAAGPAVNLDMRIPLFSADGTHLLLGDHNGVCGILRSIDLKTGAQDGIPATAEGNTVTALALSPDGQLLASGHAYSDATIRLWDAHTFARVATLEGHRGWVKRLVFAADGQILYSASADQSIRAWSIKEKRELRRWQGHADRLTGLALSLDQKTLLSCALDGSVRIWDAQGPGRRPAPAALPIPVAPYGAPFTADSRRLFTASASAPVIVWDVATAREVERIPALGTNHFSVALSPDERWLAAGSLDGRIQIWDLRGRTVVAQFQASPRGLPIYALRFLVRDKSLLSLAIIPHQRVELKRWEAGSWHEMPFGASEVPMCYGFAQSPDGRYLALCSAVAPIKLWDLASDRMEAAFGTEGSNVPAISPDGRLLAAPAFGGRTLVWEIESRRQTAALERLVNPTISVAFSPDGKRLVTGSAVGGDLQPALEIWDYVAQRSLLSLRSQGKFTGWTEFSPDGNTLLALSWHGLAELWHAPSWAEIEAAEKEQKAP
jgi:WD40 repeat protein/predicted Ser/Thr protein kinase